MAAARALVGAGLALPKMWWVCARLGRSKRRPYERQRRDCDVMPPIESLMKLKEWREKSEHP
ncbi:MAG: hypothetical protein KAW89_07265 [Armatimonadetes bacterium]|nr:hypothetical protein [Armatimonadota bacterium]